MRNKFDLIVEWKYMVLDVLKRRFLKDTFTEIVIKSYVSVIGFSF